MTISLTGLFCIILFILAIRFMATPKTANTGNYLAIISMIIAITISFSPLSEKYLWLSVAIFFGAVIGIVWGEKIKITELPQMVAILNGLGGGAAACIAIAETNILKQMYVISLLGGIIGAITLSGSLVAFCKLQGLMKKRKIFLSPLVVNLCFLILIFVSSFFINNQIFLVSVVFGLSLVWGVFMVYPVGGADMPIIISILNSFSGWATVAIGFSYSNVLMISVGTIVGASGSILAYIMIKSMNKSLLNLFIQQDLSKSEDINEKIPNEGSPKDAAFIMENARNVIIVPGYGMTAASAQYAIKNMADILEQKYGINVKFAIHPVAGRMPGHMNILLADAGVDYEKVFELDDINSEFLTTDVVYVIGANDITNPEAKTNPDSSLYGMPVLDVGKAKVVFFVKRSLNTGYSGVENPLFFAPNTIMLYGDAKKVTEDICKILEQ